MWVHVQWGHVFSGRGRWARSLTSLCLSFLPCWVEMGASAQVRGSHTYKGQVSGKDCEACSQVGQRASQLRHCPCVTLALMATEDCRPRGQGRRTCSLALSSSPHPPFSCLLMAVTTESSQARPQSLSPLSSRCPSVVPVLPDGSSERRDGAQGEADLGDRPHPGDRAGRSPAGLPEAWPWWDWSLGPSAQTSV